MSRDELVGIALVWVALLWVLIGIAVTAARSSMDRAPDVLGGSDRPACQQCGARDCSCEVASEDEWWSAVR